MTTKQETTPYEEFLWELKAIFGGYYYHSEKNQLLAILTKATKKWEQQQAVLMKGVDLV
jgi:hypothetical protein